MEQGARRFREAEMRTNGPDTSAGRRLARTLSGPLTDAIRSYQVDIVAAIEQSATPRDWSNAILLYVEPAVLAGITAWQIISGAMEEDGGKQFTSQAVRIGSLIESQLELQMWKADSKAAQKSGEDQYDRAAFLLSRMLALLWSGSTVAPWLRCRLIASRRYLD